MKREIEERNSRIETTPTLARSPKIEPTTTKNVVMI
jgi:hypothetical protein